MPAGRPLMFETPEILQKKIDEYYTKCDNTIIKRVVNKDGELISKITKPYTITGLASHLGTNRQTLINYENKDEFVDTIKKAKSLVEACYEERGLIGDSNPAVTIFSLKNNFSWEDKKTISGDKDAPLFPAVEVILPKTD